MTISFSNLIELNRDVIRNIVNVLSVKDAFADLADDEDAFQIVGETMQYVMKSEHLHFHYTAAIDYPFATDHFMATRYSDGTFPAWYGSMDQTTSIYETAYHMYRREMQIEGNQLADEIVHERLIYDVRCDAILVDLTQQQEKRDELIQNEYPYTQSIGKKLFQQGFNGIVVPSARHISGNNVSIFKPDVLKQPRINCTLTYRLYPKQKKLDVYQKNRLVQAVLL